MPSLSSCWWQVLASTYEMRSVKGFRFHADHEGLEQENLRFPSLAPGSGRSSVDAAHAYEDVIERYAYLLRDSPTNDKYR